MPASVPVAYDVDYSSLLYIAVLDGKQDRNAS